MYTGSISEKLLHHFPIYQLTELPKDAKKCVPEVLTQYYDYSNLKIDLAIKVFSKNADSLYSKFKSNNAVEENFDEFLTKFKSAIDETCKLEVPKTTRRNQLNNPWFTEGLWVSVEKRHELLRKWKKSRTKTKPLEDNGLRQKFEDYRHYLQKIIKAAKQNFHLGQFQECDGDMKKTWKLINELRGKKRVSTKPILK